MTGSHVSIEAFRVLVAAEEEDAAVTALWEAGTLGIEVQAQGGGVALLAYFPSAAMSVAALSRRIAGADVRTAEVPELDWVARYREGFRAFEVAGFRIVPAWQTTDARDPRMLVVDPGRAFGTGTHETTRLCLQALTELAARPLRRVLDLGAGTGLLGVAAARLGAETVVALDLDPEAVTSARHHAALNRVPLAVVRGDAGRALRRGAFDLVLANLAAPLLLERNEELAGLLAARGVAVLSGLLAAEQGEVAAAYAGFGAIESRVDGDWAALVLRRRSA